MIKLIYKVEGTSQEWNTEQEALVHEVFEKTEGLYIESFKLPRLVKAITDNFLLLPIVKEVKEVKEDKNETI